MRLTDIDQQLDQLSEEVGRELSALSKQPPIRLEEADAMLDALAAEAKLQVSMPPPTRLPTDPLVEVAPESEPPPIAVDQAYGSFPPAEAAISAGSSMPAGVSSSEPPPPWLKGETTERSSIPEALSPHAAYGQVPRAPAVPKVADTPPKPARSIPSVSASTFPSELPPPQPSESSSVSRSFAPPKFSDSSVPPPTGENVSVKPMMASNTDPDELAPPSSPALTAPDQLAPFHAQQSRDEPTELLALEDDDLEEMDLGEIEIEWDDDDAPALQEESTRKESIAPAMVESELESLAPEGEAHSLGSSPPPLEVAAAGSQPPDEHDWGDEFEDAFDILVDADEPTQP